MRHPMPGAALLAAVLAAIAAALLGGSASGAAANVAYLPLVAAPGQSQPPAPQPAAGFFAMRDYRTYNAATAVDPRGGVHMAFYQSDQGHGADALGQVAFYAYCPGPSQACADASAWQAVQFPSTAVDEVQVAVTADGRPRLLLRRGGQAGEEYEYWACEAQCAGPDGWSGLSVAQAAGVDLLSARNPQRSFALDPQGRPRFVWSNGWGNGKPSGIYYAACDAEDCTQPGTWAQTLVATEAQHTLTADYASLAFDGANPRFLTRVNESGLPTEVRYYACDAGCDAADGWGWSAVPNAAGKMWASWDLALDGQGRPRLALYEPAGVDISVGGRLFYAWCDMSCDAGGAPFQMAQVADGEGQGVDLARDAQGRWHMVYDAGERASLAELWCDAGCEDQPAWHRRALETSAGLRAEFAPASPLICGDQEQAWWDAIPQAAFDPQGRLVVAYDIVDYARCYTVDPADPTHRIYSSVERIWWAVRWASFPRA